MDSSNEYGQVFKKISLNFQSYETEIVMVVL